MDEYISREAVLKAFKLKVKNPKKDYQRGMQDAIDCLIPEVIAGIPSADVQPVNQWISVNDRLPDESCECLGIVDGEVTEVSYKPKQKGLICGWSMCDADGFKPLSDDTVTHWMPMPEPPQD